MFVVCYFGLFCCFLWVGPDYFVFVYSVYCFLFDFVGGCMLVVRCGLA